MIRSRIIISIITITIVGSLAILVSLYARGWRLNRQTGDLSPNGLLVIKSSPDGAQIFIDGELETATNATVSLLPDTYDVSVRKEGYLTWNKRLSIEKEIVTEVTAHLFKSAPSLSSVTFSGIANPVSSEDMTKIAYSILQNPNEPTPEQDLSGLWVIETLNLPIGFSRDPRRITDGNLEKATLVWSADAREILLTTSTGSYLLDASEFIPQSLRVNISANARQEILVVWEEERQKQTNSKLRSLPDELSDILERKTSSLQFSPDEDMVLYTASNSATIPQDLIKQLPGSSTQKQERDINEGYTYVYDIKEDRNFFVYDKPVVLGGEGLEGAEQRISWFATSRHLILAESDKITILDYDGTNRQEVYSGSYVAPHAFPTLSTDRILILTNLGASNSPPNLYSLSLK